MYVITGAVNVSVRSFLSRPCHHGNAVELRWTGSSKTCFLISNETEERARGRRKDSRCSGKTTAYSCYRIFVAEAIKLLYYDQLFDIAADLVLCVFGTSPECAV